MSLLCAESVCRTVLCMQTWSPLKKTSPISFLQISPNVLEPQQRQLGPRQGWFGAIWMAHAQWEHMLQDSVKNLVSQSTPKCAVWIEGLEHSLAPRASCSCIKLLVHLDILSNHCFVTLLLIPGLSVRGLISGSKSCFLHHLAENAKCAILNKDEQFWSRLSWFW